MAQEWEFVRQARRPTNSVEGGLPGQGGSGAISGQAYQLESATESPSSGGQLVRASPNATVRPSGRSEMLRADLLKPDLLSEIVLLGSAALLFVSLLLIVVSAVTRA
jgi:hypothetical protein